MIQPPEECEFDFQNIIPRPLLPQIHLVVTHHYEHCPSCKLNTVGPIACGRCAYRPGVDCPKCLANNSLLTNQLNGPLSCARCDFRETYEGFLQPRVDTFLDDDPELQHFDNDCDFLATRRVSKKHQLHNLIAQRMLQSAEEIHQETTERSFKKHVIKCYNQFHIDSPHAHNVAMACLKYLHAYQVVLKRRGAENKPKLEAAKKQLLPVKKDWELKFEKDYNYTASDFKSDTPLFETRVLELQIQLSNGAQSEELDRFRLWLGFRKLFSPIERSLANVRAKVGRTTGHLHNAKEVALACLWVHMEQHEEVDLLAFSRVIGEPRGAKKIAALIKAELNIQPVSFLELVQRALKSCQQELKLDFKEEDHRRMQLQLESVRDQLLDPESSLLRFEPKQVAAAVVFNSLRDVLIPGSKKKWNAKFIAEHTKNVGQPSKVTEAAHAMHYKIDLLCQKIVNKR